MTAKGWVISSAAGVLVVLLIAGTVYYVKNPNTWPLTVFNDDDKVQVVKKDKDEDNKYDAEKKDDSTDFVDTAAKTIFTGGEKGAAPSSDYAYDSTGKTGYASWTQEVKIGLIIANEYDVKNVISGSCGDVYMVTYRVPGPSVLHNSLRALFGDKVFGDFLPGNIIPSYHPNLSYSSVAIDGSVAKIYLSGTFSGSHDGTCDTTLALAQISETAKAYPNVKTVEVYQNGTLIHTSKK